jgi:hypothetical protein
VPPPPAAAASAGPRDGGTGAAAAASAAAGSSAAVSGQADPSSNSSARASMKQRVIPPRARYDLRWPYSLYLALRWGFFTGKRSPDIIFLKICEKSRTRGVKSPAWSSNRESRLIGPDPDTRCIYF